ncbi:MAG: sugar phosphate nucleotidyltransferase [Candidatus Eisenbacteria bacterium]
MLAGGRGERFWPLSRASAPKQLLALTGRRTLLQETVRRILPLIPPERIYVVTSRSIESEVRKNVAGFGRVRIIGEPVGRNTAPAIAVATALVAAKDPEGITFVAPSDHMIEGRKEFLVALRRAVGAARQGKLVVFGIAPDRPETGYGYIETRGRLPRGTSACAVRRFVEKPSPEDARKYLRSRRYFWNSGMFVWRADVLLREVQKHLPSLGEAVNGFRSGLTNRNLSVRLAGFYSRAESVSIDYGILEKTDNIVMVRGEFTWDDLGSWVSLERIAARDDSGNVCVGDVVALDVRDSVLFSQSGIVAALGVRDVVVVRTDSATLVCAKKEVQRIRRIAERLGSSRKLKRYL